MQTRWFGVVMVAAGLSACGGGAVQVPTTTVNNDARAATDELQASCVRAIPITEAPDNIARAIGPLSADQAAQVQAMWLAYIELSRASCVEHSWSLGARDCYAAALSGGTSEEAQACRDLLDEPQMVAWAEATKTVIVPMMGHLEESVSAARASSGQIGSSPPPPPPPQSVVVAPKALEALRISGDLNIVPDANTKNDIFLAAVATAKANGTSQVPTKLMGVFKLCLNVTGVLDTVQKLKSTGYPAYDQTIMTAIHQWKYRPFSSDGVPLAVCTTVQISYTQR